MTEVRQRRNAEEALAALGRRIDEAFDPARVGEVQVQVALARMEAEDRVRPLLDRAQIVLAELRAEVQRLVEEVDDPFDVEDSIQASMSDLKAEIDRAPELQ